jgi:hypothetical protein
MHGVAPASIPGDEGHVAHDGAWIWNASYGSGAPVILLHVCLGHAANWGRQVPALVNCCQWHHSGLNLMIVRSQKNV